MFWIPHEKVRVNRTVPSGGDFDEITTMETFVLDCTVQALDGSENSVNGSGASSDNRVRVHVLSPESPCVQVGDKFTYKTTSYRVTSVNDGVMNKVFNVQYKWSFIAEALVGR